MARVQPKQPTTQEVEEPKPRPKELSDLIEAHAKRYEDIRELAEDENDQYYVHWHSVPKSKAKKLIEERKKVRNGESDAFLFHTTCFTDKEFYTKELVPELENLSTDPKNFEEYSNLCLSALEKIAQAKVPSAESKKGIIHTFSHQFFNFLYKEDPRVVIGFAGLQSWRANLHNGDGDYPFHDYELQMFIEEFKKSEFSSYLPDVAEILGNIQNGFVSESYLRNVLQILSLFKKEGIEDQIPTYLTLSKKAGFPTPHGFDFKSESVVDIFKKFSGAGSHFENVLGLYTACLEKRDGRMGFGYLGDEDIDGLIEEINRLDSSEFKHRTDELLEIAALFASRGIDGSRIIRYTAQDHPIFLRNEKNILQYAIDLGAISLKCADEFLYHSEDIFGLEPDTRANLLQIGLDFAKRFGDDGEDFFEYAPAIIHLLSDKFEPWLERVDKVGERLPSLLSGWDGFMNFCGEYIQRGITDEVLDSIFLLNERIKSKSVPEEAISIIDWSESVKSAYTALLRHAVMISSAGISLTQYANDLFKLINKGFFRGLDSISNAVLHGQDYFKYVELIPELSQYGLHNLKHDNLTKFVNSDLHFNRKTEILKDYTLAALIIEEMPELDLEGNWKALCKTELEKKITDTIHIDSAGLSLTDLIKLASMSRSPSRLPIQKIKYIIDQTKNGEPIQKAFELGKLYGKATVSGISSNTNPVALTEQLVYGLISRSPEKRRMAEDYFEPEKLEEARAKIIPVLVYNLINADLTTLSTTGSIDAAKNILSILSKQYPNLEALSDMIVGIESRFEKDIRFDTLEMRMQQGSFSDLFDNRRLLCCTFYPSGQRKEASINYLLDENIGLLHMVPKEADTPSDPIGVAVLINTICPKTKEKYLLVDSVEAGTQIDRIADSTWIPLAHSAILEVARDNGASKVIYLGRAYNAKPKRVINYLQKNFNPVEDTVELNKLNEPEPLLSSFIQDELPKLREALQAYYDSMKDERNNETRDNEDFDPWGREREGDYSLRSKAEEQLKKIFSTYDIDLDSTHTAYNMSGDFDRLLKRPAGSLELNLSIPITRGDISGLVFDVPSTSFQFEIPLKAKQLSEQSIEEYAPLTS